MKTLLLTIVAVCSFATGLYGQTNEEKYLEAVSFIESGKAKKSIPILEEIIKSDSKQCRFYLALVTALFSTNDYEAAFTLLKDAGEELEDSIAFYTFRADVFYQIKEFKKAANDYFSAIDLTEDSTMLSMLYMNLGNMYLNPSGAEDALKYLEKAKLYDSTNMAIYNGLAMAYDIVGEEEKVFENLEAMLVDDSLKVFAITNLGFFHQQYGNYKESLKYLNQAIELNPTFAYTYSNRAFTKMKLGDFKGAKEDVEKSIEMDPNNSWAYKVRAQINIAQGKKGKKVCSDLEMALKLQFTKQYGPEVENLYREHCQ